MNIDKKRLKKIIIISSIVILLLVIIGLLVDKLDILDETIYNFIISFKSPLMTRIFKVITFFASIPWFIVIIALSFIFIKDKRLNVCLIIYLLFIALIVLGLKNVFVRERPYELMIIEEFGYSFPSGHSSVAIAFYGFIGYIVYKSSLKKSFKGVTISLLILLSFFIGISRIYLGVHYPSDVIAGFMVGIIYLMIFINVVKVLRKRGRNEENYFN